MPSLLIILNLTILIALIACGSGEQKSENTAKPQPALTSSQSTGSEPVDGDWLIYHLSAEPAILNPITATEAYESTVNSGKSYTHLPFTLTERGSIADLMSSCKKNMGLDH